MKSTDQLVARTSCRRGQQWPRIDKRIYPSGVTSWIVDCGLQQGKRVRETFTSKGEAETVAEQQRIARANEGVLSAATTLETRLEAARCLIKLAPYGATLTEATDHYVGQVLRYRTGPSVAELIDQLLTQKRSSGCRATTICTLEYFFNRVRDLFGARRLSEISLAELKPLCLAPELAPRTRFNRIRLLRQLYNHAVAAGWVGENLAARISAPIYEVDEPGVLPVAEAYQLLMHADNYGLLGYVGVVLLGGVRSAEALKMNWSSVKTADQEIVIGASIAKTRARRVIPYAETLAAWLPVGSRRTGPLVDQEHFERNFNALRKAAGISVWPHNALRHSFASYHLAAFRDPVRTAYLMGHRSGTDMLDSCYKGLVSGVDARQFWALRPGHLALREAA